MRLTDMCVTTAVLRRTCVDRGWADLFPMPV